MSVIFTIVLMLALIKIIRDNLFYLWLWQVKEYRTDRMIAHFKDGKNLFEKKNNQFLCLVVLFVFCFYQTFFIYVAGMFFAFTFYQILLEIKGRTLKRPKLTFKAILVLLTTLIFYICITTVCYLNKDISLVFTTLLMLFFYLIAPILVTVIVLSINPIFNFQKKRIIKKATDKMRTLKKIKVIGITGSYGKTSTKEFLNTILCEKFKVVKTEGNNNTNIGVAYTVLNKVNDDYDYFICEMGAYKIGEIAEMCEIVKPQMGILTGINEQHLDLFGSVENTKKAKFELIESLPENGVAVINETLKLEKEKRKFSVKDVRYFSANAVAGLKESENGLEFNYKDVEFKTNIKGVYYIENLLSAIVVAENLGMSLGEIKEAVKKIKPSMFTLREIEGLNESVFIDDSYSANPDGVIAALDYLDKSYQDYKKIIVFPGIIELGDSSEEVHKKLFSKIDEVCDKAYILNTESKSFKDEGNKFIFEKDFNKTVQMLKKDLDKKTVVLFESRGAGVVMKKLLKQDHV